MNKFPKYREFRGLAAVDDFVSPVPEVREKSERVQKDAEILAAIFSLDPLSGCPRGDIAQFMSEDTNPQIAQYIKTRLMQEQTPVGQAAVNSGLTDDDLLKLERKSGESVGDYVNRVNGFIVDDLRSRRQSVSSNSN